MKNDVENYLVCRKRKDREFAAGFESGCRKMKRELFDGLMHSVKEAEAIERGEQKPSRVLP